MMNDGRSRDLEVLDRLGKNILGVRLRAGFSQQMLADRSGLHRTEIGLLERGGRSPRIDTLLKIAGSLENAPSRSSWKGSNGSPARHLRRAPSPWPNSPSMSPGEGWRGNDATSRESSSALSPTASFAPLGPAAIHPIRRGSLPGRLCRPTRKPVMNIAYRVRELERLGVLELVRTEPIRGLWKHCCRTTKFAKVTPWVLTVLGLQKAG